MLTSEAVKPSVLRLCARVILALTVALAVRPAGAQDRRDADVRAAIDRILRRHVPPDGPGPWWRSSATGAPVRYLTAGSSRSQTGQLSFWTSATFLSVRR